MATDDPANILIWSVSQRTGLKQETVEDLFYNEWAFTEKFDGTRQWSHSDWERLNNVWHREQGKRGRQGGISIQEMDGQGQEDG